MAAATPAASLNASLYVGDLDPAVSESALFELFSQQGPVVTIRVCRDLVTRRSLGYAYVNFATPADAAKAIEELNGNTTLNGNSAPIRVTFSQRDPSLRKSGLGNVYIKGLDRSIDSRELYDTFAQFGTIISAKVAMENGQSKGYAFVQFDSDDAAKRAIETVNGMELKGKKVYVGPFQRRSERPQDKKFTNVYVKNLNENVNDEKLKEMFAPYGTITSAVVMQDASGKTKCFGFVNFETAEAAQAAVEALEGKEIDGKTLNVCRAQKKAERQAALRAKHDAEHRSRIEKLQGVNLYIKNLEDSVDEDKLREIFKEYGTITGANVQRDRTTGVHKGVGFVTFSTPEEATKAVTEMNGKMVQGKPIYVALAQRKEDRQARFQQHFARPPQMPNMPPGMQYMGAQMGQGPLFYGQPPPGLPQMPPGAQGFGFQPVLPPGGRPGPVLPQYMMPGQGMQGRQGVAGRGPAARAGRGVGPQGVVPAGRGGRGAAGVRLVPGARVGDGAQDASHAPALPSGPAPTPAAASAASATPASPVAVLAQQLASAAPEAQRMLLGEALYPLVEQVDAPQASKVTGMLLEMDQGEVLHLIEDNSALVAKVQEAKAVLRAAQAAGQISA